MVNEIRKVYSFSAGMHAQAAEVQIYEEAAWRKSQKRLRPPTETVRGSDRIARLSQEWGDNAMDDAIVSQSEQPESQVEEPSQEESSGSPQGDHLSQNPIFGCYGMVGLPPNSEKQAEANSQDMDRACRVDDLRYLIFGHRYCRQCYIRLRRQDILRHPLQLCQTIFWLIQEIVQRKRS